MELIPGACAIGDTPSAYLAHSMLLKAQDICGILVNSPLDYTRGEGIPLMVGPRGFLIFFSLLASGLHGRGWVGGTERFLKPFTKPHFVLVVTWPDHMGICVL